MIPLIPFDEFAAKAERAQRRLVAALIAFLPATFVVPVLASLVKSAFADMAGSEWAGTAAYSVLLLSFLVVVVGLVWFLLAKGAIHCPHCRAILTQQSGLVMSTRNCFSCGRRVLGEPSDSDAVARLTREELNQMALAYVKREGWLTLGVLMGTAACLGAYAAVRDSLVAWLGTYMAELTADIGSLVLPAAGVLAILCLYLRQSRRLRSDPRAGCPHCGRSLLLRGAGSNCGHCGRKAVTDEVVADVVPVESVPLRDFEEFRAASAYYHGRGAAKMIALALGSVVAGGLLSLAIVLLSGFHDKEAASTFAPPARVALGIAAFTPFVLGFAGFFVVLVRLERRTAADVRSQCPACGHGLIQSHLTVIASRHCPKCRRRILAEPTGE